jgi:hypothetical protein
VRVLEVQVPADATAKHLGVRDSAGGGNAQGGFFVLVARYEAENDK